VGDARALNWRFIVPGETQRSLLLSVDGERLPGWISPPLTRSGLSGALVGRRYPAVVAVDASRWSHRLRIPPAHLLGRLAEAVDPGGYLCVGFANPWYPGAPGAAGSLSGAGAERVIAEGGLQLHHRYLAFPSVDCPAYLVDRDDAACVSYFVHRISIPFVAGSGISARAKQRVLRAMRRIAIVAPHSERVRFAPGTVIVARRSP